MKLKKEVNKIKGQTYNVQQQLKMKCEIENPAMENNKD